VTTGGQTSTVSARSVGQTTVTATVTGTSVSMGLAVTVTDTAPTPPAPPRAAGCDTSGAALMFSSGFEDGEPVFPRAPDTGDWDGFAIGQVGTQAWNLTKVTSPARECSAAARVELRRTDPIIAGNNRAQLQVAETGFGNGGVPVPKGRTVAGGLGDERWFGFSVFIPSDWIFETGWAPELIWEAHDAGVRSPPLSLSITGSQWMIQNITGHGAQNDRSWLTRLDYAPVERGVWTDWVVHVKWSSGTDGVLQVWKNGVMIVNRSNTWTAFTDTGPYIKPLWGIYKWSWNGRTSGGASIVSSRVLYLDNVRITDGEHGSYAAVAPR
jgi:hypothetical protein